ncbi:MAG TPA: glutamyl-tRNA reductase [Thermoanaerobaculia bacterium]|nr:glutamyl-tRNA reductase [Thermoanaerobaculia bacterium]
MASSSPHRFPPLLLVGTDHRSAPLALREKVAYDEDGVEELLVHLLAREEVGEAVVLSTCNRTEIYAVPHDDGDGESLYRTVLDQTFLTRAPEIEREGRLYVLRDDEAARHLLAVASGLESMVLGEPEILGQVKQAAELAAAVGAAGPVVQHLLRSAAEAGRRSRHETAIGAGAVSLGYAVVELATNVFRDLAGVRVLVLGAGETARQVVRNLTERGSTDVTVANRGRERAEALRADFPSISLLPLEERAEAARRADLIVTTTGAPEPLFRRHDLDHAQERRSSRPLLVVDLGVPRNVDPAAGELDNLFLHSIDSLEGLIDRNLRRRREEVPKVEELVTDELDRFAGWYRGREAEPLVARLQKQAEAIRRREVEAAKKRFPAETHDDLDRFTRSLVRKLLHNPSAGLRGGDADLRRLDLVAELFRLDDERGDDADGKAKRTGEPHEKGSPA